MLLDSMEWKYWSNIPQLDSTIVLVWMGSWDYFTAKPQVLWLLYNSMTKVVNQVLSGCKGSLSKNTFAMSVSFDLKKYYWRRRERKESCTDVLFLKLFIFLRPVVYKWFTSLIRSNYSEYSQLCLYFSFSLFLNYFLY